jgi:hypothetical protein
MDRAVRLCLVPQRSLAAGTERKTRNTNGCGPYETGTRVERVPTRLTGRQECLQIAGIAERMNNATDGAQHALTDMLSGGLRGTWR